MRPARSDDRGALAVLWLTVFIDMFGFGIIIPFLPFWAERFGATPLKVTLLMSTFAAMQFVFAFVWGRVSDRWGRKPVLLVSLAGSVLSFTVLAFAGALWMLFAARALAGIMGGSIGVAHAYVADVTPKERRAHFMGLMGAAFGLGFMLGPAVGGLLAGADPANPDFRTPFLAGAALSAAAFVLGLIFLREPRGRAARSPSGEPGEQWRAFVAVAGRPAVILPVAAAMALAFVMSGIASTFPLWTERQFHWGPRENGYLFSYIGIIMVVVQAGLVGRVARRVGEARLAVAALAALALGALSFPFADFLPVLAGAALSAGLVALGYSFANPVLSSLTSQGAPADQQGAVLGAAQSVQSLARIFGPAFAGAMFGAYGRHSPFIAEAAIMGLTVIAAIVLARRLRQSAARRRNQSRAAP